MSMKTGIYIRVSTEEQVQEGFSIRGQTEKLKTYALIKEWEIYDIYSESCDIIEPTQETAINQGFQRVGSNYIKKYHKMGLILRQKNRTLKSRREVLPHKRRKKWAK